MRWPIHIAMTQGRDHCLNELRRTTAVGVTKQAQMKESKMSDTFETFKRSVETLLTGWAQEKAYREDLSHLNQALYVLQQQEKIVEKVCMRRDSSCVAAAVNTEACSVGTSALAQYSTSEKLQAKDNCKKKGQKGKGPLCRTGTWQCPRAPEDEMPAIIMDAFPEILHGDKQGGGHRLPSTSSSSPPTSSLRCLSQLLSFVAYSEVINDAKKW